MISDGTGRLDRDRPVDHHDDALLGHGTSPFREFDAVSLPHTQASPLARSARAEDGGARDGLLVFRGVRQAFPNGAANSAIGSRPSFFLREALHGRPRQEVAERPFEVPSARSSETDGAGIIWGWERR